MILRAFLGVCLVLSACGGEESGGGEAAPPGGENAGGEVAAGACQTDADCEAQGSDQCPGGSVAYATCVEGTCQFEACSSPIGTPCDDDPSTVFDDEDCPE